LYFNIFFVINILKQIKKGALMITSSPISFEKRYPSLDAKPVEPYHLLADLFHLVCRNLDIKTLGRASMVSRHWHVMSSDDSIWKVHEKEFKVEAPNIKLQIWRSKTTLEGIYNEIRSKMFKQNSKHVEFFCDLVKILFDGNIKFIKVSENIKNLKFTIMLNKTRKVFFKIPSFWNIQIPTLVCLKFTDYGQLKFCKTDVGITDIGINVFGPRNSYCKRIQISEADEVAIASRIKQGIFISQNSWVYFKTKNLKNFSDSVLFKKEWI